MAEEQERMIRVTENDWEEFCEWRNEVAIIISRTADKDFPELKNGVRHEPFWLQELEIWQDLELAPRPEKEIREKIADVYADEGIGNEEAHLIIKTLLWAFPRLSEEKKEK